MNIFSSFSGNLSTVQEDPFKLVVLGKHAQQASITNVDFFFRDGEIAIVAGDDEGVIRMFEYDPTSKKAPPRAHIRS